MCACQLEIQRWTEESVAKIFTAAESGVVCRVQEEERESRAFRGIYSCGSDVKGGSLKSLARVRERERDGGKASSIRVIDSVRGVLAGCGISYIRRKGMMFVKRIPAVEIEKYRDILVGLNFLSSPFVLHIIP